MHSSRIATGRLALAVVVAALGASARAEAQPAETCTNLGASVKDAAISAALPSVNFGLQPVATIAPGTKQALFAWDLSGIPADATLTSATLTFQEAGSPGLVSTHAITSAWAEPTVTWSSFSSSFDPVPVATTPNAPGRGTLSVDITPLALDWLTGARANHGVLLGRDAGVTTLHTREAAPKHRPALVLCYTPAVDECALGTDNCDANATCTDTSESFGCTCNAGFEGDGVTCTDIDECALGTDNCDAEVTCTNTPGSFTCACDAGSTLACYDGPAGTQDVGTCRSGARSCNGTSYGACVGSVGPTAEVCGDGLDNDCDGTVDDGCVCAPGATTACYDGPSGTAGVGVCSAGTQTCNATGTGYGACVGAVTPTPDICGDGLDNNCDGASDESCVCMPGSTSSCYNGPSGTEGVGACHAGAMVCSASGSGYGACVGEVTPTTEVCGDGVDNDCDGIVDEGCIGNRAWRDANVNGLQDPGEVGVPGVTFMLRLASSGALVAIAVSDANGRYSFSGVPSGNYYIEASLPAGFGVTSPDTGDDTLDSDFDGESLATIIFAFGGTADFTWDIGLVPGTGS
jgi:hypothetical protein